MHALITGASRGIGLAIAERLATQHGAQLSLCARSEPDLLAARNGIESRTSSKVFTAVCDVTSERDIARLAEDAQKAFGPIDLLVNNAGIGIFRPVQEMTSVEFDQVLAINLRGVFLMTQAVLPQMKQHKSGTIVTIGSLASKNGFAGGAAYCASKFGVRGLMLSLFLDVRAFDIRVMTIFPGTVETEFFHSNEPSKITRPLQAEDIAEAVAAVIHLPPRATISELDIRPTNPK
ncbi:MAG: SDR family NAD(P)-dependent oxidoreductase [Bacteroidota bacterium]|nr:SDR family NAD(P)-dependent oxidoreductase [Bacteroidota bacterium]